MLSCRVQAGSFDVRTGKKKSDCGRLKKKEGNRKEGKSKNVLPVRFKPLWMMQKKERQSLNAAIIKPENNIDGQK